MKRDLRLYYYESGSLRKHGSLKSGIRTKHFFKSEEEIQEVLDWYTINSNRLRINHQYVVVEYFAIYQSKIIKVIEI